MLKYTNQFSKQKELLYNSLLLLARNKLFYTKFNLIDTFQNRIHLIFIHVSFIFIKIKIKNDSKTYKKFYQEMFDLIFNKIELNMREIGFGDTTINKNMRFLVKTFYSILLNCEKYTKKDNSEKNTFLNKYLIKTNRNMSNNNHIIEYFNKYESFCFDLESDSVLKGELLFKY